MAKVLAGITIETFPEAVRQGLIKPGDRFSITLENAEIRRESLSDIARRMRAKAVEKGMTTEIFDTLISQP